MVHGRYVPAEQHGTPPRPPGHKHHDLQRAATLHDLPAEPLRLQLLEVGPPHRARALPRGTQAVCRDDGAGGGAGGQLLLQPRLGADQPGDCADQPGGCRHALPLRPGPLPHRHHHRERAAAARGEQAQRGDQRAERTDSIRQRGGQPAQLPQHQGGGGADGGGRRQRAAVHRAHRRRHGTGHREQPRHRVHGTPAPAGREQPGLRQGQRRTEGEHLHAAGLGTDGRRPAPQLQRPARRAVCEREPEPPHTGLGQGTRTGARGSLEPRTGEHADGAAHDSLRAERAARGEAV